MKKTIYIILAITAVAYLIISAVKRTLNPFKWFAATSPSNGTCNNFYVKLADLGNKKIQSLHVWTSGEKYYKQESILILDGIESEKEIIEITKQEFDGFCKDKFNPPAEYKWYYEKPGTSTGH